MYKFKSRIDTEVIVTDFHELMINNNEKKTNELGRSSRSSHQENLVPGDTLGAISCSGSFEDGTPFTCKVGVFSGFTKEDLRAIWNHKERFLGQLMKIKYMGIGSDKAPRTPVALGFRNPIDL
jgi:DNA ligase-1